MSRVTLLALQALVAVVCIVLWQVLSTVPVFGKILLPPFFFSRSSSSTVHVLLVRARGSCPAFITSPSPSGRRARSSLHARPHHGRRGYSSLT